MKMRPFTHKKTLAFFMVVASLVGIFTDYSMGTQVDYWIHDSAIVHQYRKEWKYSGIVVLDNDVPFRVTRIQALPLFARAIDHLVAQGAKGVFLDAQVSKEIEGTMPYAVCLETDSNKQIQARWSRPKCGVSSGNNHTCTITNSEAGNAPLKMTTDSIARFRIAPYLNDTDHLPEDLLYDFEAAAAIPEAGIVAHERLVRHSSSPIGRWLDMSDDHAIFKLASLLMPEKIAKLYEKNSLLDQECDDNRRCRRIRLSKPIHDINIENSHLILPLSQLASCDEAVANKTASLLKNKLAILQVAAPSEATDIIVTPMTTALFSPQLMTPGAQYLVDEIETLLNQDYPQQPPQAVRILLFICAAAFSVLLGAYFSQALLLLGAAAIFIVMAALCFFYPIVQLWPVTAVMVTYSFGALQIVSMQLILGGRKGKILSEILPKQVLDQLEKVDSFRSKQCKVVVLMSDLAGYTTVTELLKKPEYVMDLMNDYLGSTSIVLQKEYNGILEAYVGDMVCYYWEYEEEEKLVVYKQVLSASIKLSVLQKNFFSSVAERYKELLTPEVLKEISILINAGIGITAGTVVKGNLGPKTGLKKFAILGDPINLASRVESLTRHFNTEIIVTGDFAKAIAADENLAARRLGAIKVKGKLVPEVLYALGQKSDPRFMVENIKAWEEWITEIEKKANAKNSANARIIAACPMIYSKDCKTVLDWREKGVMDENGVWQLHEK